MTAVTVNRRDGVAVPASADSTGGADGTVRDPVGAASRRRTIRQRWDDLPLRTKGVYVIGIPMVPLMLSALLFWAGARTLRSAQDWVSHTLEVKAEIATVLSLLVDAQSGVRGACFGSVVVLPSPYMSMANAT